MNEGCSFAAAAQAVEVGEQSLRQWHARLAPQLESCGEDATLGELQAENQRLRRELRRADLVDWRGKQSVFSWCQTCGRRRCGINSDQKFPANGETVACGSFGTDVPCRIPGHSRTPTVLPSLPSESGDDARNSSTEQLQPVCVLSPPYSNFQTKPLAYTGRNRRGFRYHVQLLLSAPNCTLNMAHRDQIWS